jgi:hypothetical protein
VSEPAAAPPASKPKKAAAPTKAKTTKPAKASGKSVAIYAAAPRRGVSPPAMGYDGLAGQECRRIDGIRLRRRAHARLPSI